MGARFHAYAVPIKSGPRTIEMLHMGAYGRAAEVLQRLLRDDPLWWSDPIVAKSTIPASKFNRSRGPGKNPLRSVVVTTRVVA